MRRRAEAATTGATRRESGIGLAMAVRPTVTTTGDDAESRRRLSEALCAGEAAGGRMDGEGGWSARRREQQPTSMIGTGVATARLVAHVTQPELWEPGVT